MKARPSFQFYPADWLRDPGLRSCSLGARGLWIDMLAFMHEGEVYGHLRVNGRDLGVEALARMVGAPAKQVEHHLRELETVGVFSRSDAGTIYSRRMVRDEALRAKRGQYGHLALQNPAVPRKKDTEKDTIKDTLSPSLAPSFGGSPSSSSSSSEEKDIRASRSDELNGHRNGFELFWRNYPRKRGKGAAERVWANLKPDDLLLGTMLAKVEQAKQTEDWQKERGRFIPYPASWLNGKGWLDEYEPACRKERIPL